MMTLITDNYEVEVFKFSRTVNSFTVLTEERLPSSAICKIFLINSGHSDLTYSYNEQYDYFYVSTMKRFESDKIAIAGRYLPFLHYKELDGTYSTTFELIGE